MICLPVDVPRLSIKVTKGVYKVFTSKANEPNAKPILPNTRDRNSTWVIGSP